MIISLSGYMGSGKDTIADYLVTKYNFKRLSFSAPIKDIVSTVFGMDRELLEGLTPEAREWRENHIDHFWDERLGLDKDVTPRVLLQTVGSDIFRKFHSSIWVRSLEHKLINNPNVDYVISDTRFVNEANMLRERGAQIWGVHRKAQPELKAIYKAWNMNGVMPNVTSGGYSHTNAELARKALAEAGLKIHDSNWQYLLIAYDEIIPNTKSLDHLYAKVDRLIDEHVWNNENH
jgi:dephospho-CoA kinase